MKTRGPRLSAEQRREQIIDVAERLLVESGHLPLEFERIAQELGVSRTLIYARFSEQRDLINAILRRHFQRLIESGLNEAVSLEAMGDATQRAAELYFLHVARHGPVVGILLRDPYSAEQLEPDLLDRYSHWLRRLTAKLEQELHLGDRADAALLNMLLAIPDEAGRLVYRGQLELDKGRKLCAELLRVSLEALRPSERAWT